MDFSKMTDAELIELNKTLNAEIARRKEVKKDLARKELEKLLDRVNELQHEYDFEIACCDNYGDTIGSAYAFEL